jgi:deoxyribodipyrimidine photo-lyase
VLQGKKFDSTGAYVKKWVPELAHFSAEHIHAPWERELSLMPIVDLKGSRERALIAYKKIKAKNDE